MCRGRWRPPASGFLFPAFFTTIFMQGRMLREIIDQNIDKGSTDWGIEYLNLIGCFNLINTTFVQTSLPSTHKLANICKNFRTSCELPKSKVS